MYVFGVDYFKAKKMCILQRKCSRKKDGLIEFNIASSGTNPLGEMLNFG